MKMRIIITIMMVMMIGMASFGQRYITKNGYIKFFSEAPLETIEAHNRQVNCALDTETGNIVFKVLMKSFEFEKALMQEHFNENYVMSNQYPNATFQGKIKNIDEVDFSKEGEYKALVEGDLTIKGVTNQVSEEGTFTVMEDKIMGNAVFNIKVSDYEIKIPNAVVDNISETIEITVDVTLEELKK